MLSILWLNRKCKKNICFSLVTIGKSWNLYGFVKIYLVQFCNTLKIFRSFCLYKHKIFLFSNNSTYFNNNKDVLIFKQYYTNNLVKKITYSSLHVQISILKYLNLMHIHIYDYDYTYFGNIRKINYNGYHFIAFICLHNKRNICTLVEYSFIKILKHDKRYIVMNSLIFI